MRFLSFIFFLLGFLSLIFFAQRGDYHAQIYPTLALGALSLFFAIFTIGKLRLRKENVYAITIALIAYIYFSIRALYSPVEYLSRYDLLLVQLFFLGFLAFVLFFSTESYRGFFQYTLAFILLASVPICFLQMRDPSFNLLKPIFGITRRFSSDERPFGGFYNLHNHFAGFIAPVSVIFLTRAIVGKKKLKRLIFFLLAVVGIVLVYLSTSRGGMINLVVGVAACFFLCAVFLRVDKAFLGILHKFLPIVAVLSVIFLVFISIFGTHLPKIARSALGGDNRTDNWAAAFPQIKQAPIFGNGGSAYQYQQMIHWSDKLGSFHKDMVYAHNDYLQCLTDYGFVGLFFAIACIFIAYKIPLGFLIHAKRSYEKSEKIDPRVPIVLSTLAAFTGLLAHEVVEFNLHMPPSALLAGCFLGFLVNPGVKVKPKRQFQMSLAPALMSIVCAALCVTLCFRHAQAEYYFEKAKHLKRKGDKKFLKYFIETKNYDTANFNSHSRLGLHYFFKGLRFKNKIPIDSYKGERRKKVISIVRSPFFSANEFFRLEFEKHPYNYRAAINVAATCLELAKLSETEVDRARLLQDAVTYYEKAIPLCPRRKRPYQVFNHFIESYYLKWLIESGHLPHAKIIAQKFLDNCEIMKQLISWENVKTKKMREILQLLEQNKSNEALELLK